MMVWRVRRRRAYCKIPITYDLCFFRASSLNQSLFLKWSLQALVYKTKTFINIISRKIKKTRENCVLFLNIIVILLLL